MLSKDKYPIAYASKALSNKTQKKKTLQLSMYDKEMLVVVYVVNHRKLYLMGTPFKIITDHKTLHQFFNQRITIP